MFFLQYLYAFDTSTVKTKVLVSLHRVILSLESPNKFGKSIPEFEETHSSVLGCERRPVSASIISRSCFGSFLVCVYKFSSHYLNNIIFYRQQFGNSSDRITLYLHVTFLRCLICTPAGRWLGSVSQTSELSSSLCFSTVSKCGLQ